MFVDALTCQGLSQSSGIGKAPSQAPTILDIDVNCTTLSITVSGLCIDKTIRLVHYLGHCILETPKQVLWQTVKTQMKCSIMLHFIRVYTFCYGQNKLLGL